MDNVDKMDLQNQLDAFQLAPVDRSAMYLAKADASGVAIYAPDRDRYAHRRLGFVEVGRNSILALDLSGISAPAVAPAARSPSPPTRAATE
jgi:hypothetical protein